MRPVAKRSTGKVNAGGAKTAFRILDDDGQGRAVDERFTTTGRTPTRLHRPLQVDVIVDGQTVHRPTNDEIRAHHQRALAELRPLDRTTNAGPPVFTATPLEEP
jgi:nicotinate phosphoribosyltransferase